LGYSNTFFRSLSVSKDKHIEAHNFRLSVNKPSERKVMSITIL
jgi:hypothetical protein